MTEQKEGVAHAPANLKYLDFLLAVYEPREVDQKLMLLAPDEQRLLEIIAVRHAINQPLSMMQALELRDVLFLSPSAVSRKIDNLRAANLIRVVVSETDRRVKFIELTETAMSYFGRLGALMTGCSGVE